MFERLPGFRKKLIRQISGPLCFSWPHPRRLRFPHVYANTSIHTDRDHGRLAQAICSELNAACDPGDAGSAIEEGRFKGGCLV